jgi:hypothetical protein
MVWTIWRKLLTLTGLELRPLGRPAGRYTDYAIPDRFNILFIILIIIIIIIIIIRLEE